MKIKIQKMLVAMSVLLVSSFGLMPALAYAAVNCDASDLTTQQAINCGAANASGSDQTSGQAESNINSTIKTLVNLLSIIVGIVAVIMIIIGGMRYVTSGGKQESVAGAKNTILYAIVGLVVVALAQVIARFVLTHVTKGK